MPENKEYSEGVNKIKEVSDEILESGKKYGLDVMETGSYKILLDSSVETDENGYVTAIKAADEKDTSERINQYQRSHMFMKVLGWDEKDLEEFDQKFASKNMDINGTEVTRQIESANGLASRDVLEATVKQVNANGFTPEEAAKSVKGTLDSFVENQQKNLLGRVPLRTMDDIQAMHEYLETFGVNAQGVADPQALMRLYQQTLGAYAQMRAMQENQG